ncbi:MAG TPA: methyltransferase domain-containing protein [Candidatus Limnocylindria bacterium]|nr:methyltransferase domain-containing protein [Candidatus Limnocylindria bacterium]
MSSTASPAFGRVGRQVQAPSALRPAAEDEIGAWGGPRLFRGRRVLDLGCGDGRLALGIAPYAREVHGIDPDAALIRSARARARARGARNARFAVGAAQELPYDDRAFDVVVLSWTL